MLKYLCIIGIDVNKLNYDWPICIALDKDELSSKAEKPKKKKKKKKGDFEKLW